MGVLRAGALPGLHMQPTAQVINGSLKFEKSASNYLSRTFSAGNRKTFTVSFWHKHSNHSEGASVGAGGGKIFSTGTVGAGARGEFGFAGVTNGSNEDKVSIGFNATGSTWKSLTSDPFFRDFAAWQHFVIAVDCTQGTASNRVKFYVNGVQQSLSGSYPNNENQQFNNNVGHAIGRYNAEGTDYYSGLLSNFYFIDGQQLDESDFGFTDPQTNTWRPKKYTGTFGTTGFWLPMDDEDDFAMDKSGNGNNWTENNFSGTSVNPDVLKDSPSGAVSGGRAQTGITTTSSAPANYCTLNPIDAFVSTKDGNLETATSSGWQGIRATLGMKSGKFYWETQNNQTAAAILGIADTQATGFVDGAIFGSTGHDGGDANPAWTWAGANYYFNATSAAAGSLANHTSSDIVQYAFDADSGNLWFGRNGTWYSSSWATTGDPANGVNPTVSGIDTTKTYVACGTFYNGSAKFNFGQKPFKYAPPQGFLPLNSASNTPETVIPRPKDYVGALAYDGDGNPRIVSGLSMKPDFIWIKNRSAQQKHTLVNSVSTTATGEYLASNAEDNEGTGVHISGVKNGISIAAPNEDTIWYNDSSYDYVALCWKAGGSKNTFNVDDIGYASASAAGLDGGSVTPAGASVGTKQGFSIIAWARSSGTDTISHGLSQAPTFIIQKSTSADKRWQVGWEVEGWDRRLYLNLTDADSDSTSFGWSGNFGPTNTLIRTGGTSYVDGDMIAFCWHDVPGLQKFGKFSGNGGADGVFVELGFRPAILLIKNDNSTGDWIIWDNARDPVNPANKQIWPYTDSGTYGAYDQVGSNYPLDFLSNGFKMRTTDADMNSSSRTYLYAAWAEQPASNLFGGQSTGR